MTVPWKAEVFAGVDLAAEPGRTGFARLQRTPQGRVVVEDAGCGLDDEELIEMLSGVSKAGIDVPFGWPAGFVEFLADHALQQHAASMAADVRWRRGMVLRRTDQLVHQWCGLTPLSVAADRIAYPALRWAAVEARLRDRGMDCQRDGTGRVCEAYPAAALKVWQLPFRGYKREVELREDIVAGLIEQCAVDWNGYDSVCVSSDDALDAVISALVAVEAADGRTRVPTAVEEKDALTEGWIHVPFGTVAA